LAVNRDQSLFEFFGPYISGAQRLEYLHLVMSIPKIGTHGEH